MTDKELDELLQMTLAPVEPNEDLNRNLKRKMEVGRMKHFSVKKTIGLAAASCLLVGTVSVASSGIFYSTVGHSSAREYKSFNQLEEVEAKAGYSIHAVENFSNGYQFDSMNIEYGQNLDENGNELNKFTGIDITYQKAGQDWLVLNTVAESEMISAQDNRTPTATVTVDGITINYYVDTYKWVPGDYKLTAEDEVNQQRNNYHISYGADKVSENQVSCVVWTQEGIHYTLMNIQNATPAETLFQMAGEIIELQ